MALPSSPASTIHQPPRISSISCCCPPSPCPLQIQSSSRPTPPAAYKIHHLLPLRVATASSTASSITRGRGRGHLPPPAALPDPQSAAVPLLAAAGTVVAASLLLRSSSSSSSSASQQQRQEEQEQLEGEECPDCGGTGLCGRCKGEGFVFKQLSEETATKARKAAKNMATRYTAGLPTKWTYCNKCSSTRSCTTCRGSGRIITTTPVT